MLINETLNIFLVPHMLMNSSPGKFYDAMRSIFNYFYLSSFIYCVSLALFSNMPNFSDSNVNPMKITGMTWRRAVWEWPDLNADLGPLGEMGPDKSLLDLHNFDMDTFGKPQTIVKKGLLSENHYY